MAFALALAPAVALGFGCRSGEQASRNLDTLMGSEERLAYVGNVQSPFEFLFGGLFRKVGVTGENWFTGKASDPIPDPTDAVVDNLLALAATGDGPRAWREAVEVRHFARYAAECPAALGRERALLELAVHGERLGLAGPYVAPARAANAEELRVRIASLVDAAAGLRARGAAATALADFSAACDVLAAAEVDLAGGRRALAALAPFLRGGALPSSEARARLVQVSESLQRRVVGEALARALQDPTPFVRAAAYRACLATYGEPFLVEAALCLGVRPTQPFLPGGHGEPYTRFGLASEPPDVGEVRRVVCNALATGGLPEVARGEDARGLALRFGVYVTLLQVATRFDAFDSESRAQAMLTLEALSGAGLDSIREEAWDRWWRGVGPELEARFKAAAAEEAAGERESETPQQAGGASGRPPMEPQG